MKNTLISMLLVLIPGLTHAQSGARHVRGQIQLWSQPVCTEQVSCPLPKPLGVGWNVDLNFTEPTAQGTTRVVDQLYSNADYQFHLEQFWVVRAGKAPYIVTQSRLSSVDGHVIAVCTRYDDAEAFTGLAPGSCGGQVGDSLIGAAFFGPTK